MIGPAVAGSAGLGFGAAGITAESHPGRGPFDRPTANPTNPAAKIANTINKGLTDLLIANLPPDVPSRRISSAARLSASRGQAGRLEAGDRLREQKKDPGNRPGNLSSRPS